MKLILVLIVTLISITLAIHPHLAQAQSDDASPSSEPAVSTIKENVKKRIESVVKGQQTAADEKTATFGVLTSIANETLTLKTNKGTKLASTSNLTTYVNLATSKAIKLEDIGIDDYISILGYITPSGVIDARRILLSSEPEKPELVSIFGYISSVDETEDLITLTNPLDSQLIEFTTNSKSVLENQLNQSRTEIELADLIPDSLVLIIYKPNTTGDNPQIISQLLASQASITPPTPTASEEPSPTIEADLKKIIPTGLQ